MVRRLIYIETVPSLPLVKVLDVWHEANCYLEWVLVGEIAISGSDHDEYNRWNGMQYKPIIA